MRRRSTLLLAGLALAVLLALLAVAALRLAQPDAPEAAGAGLDVASRLSGDAPAAEGWARAVEPRAFRFPEDHGPHPGFRTEWWYFTGNLQTADGDRFGFQITFFRNGLRPPEGDQRVQGGEREPRGEEEPGGERADTSEEGRTSRWAAREAWMAHFAVTDVEAGSFVAFERFERGALGLAGAGRTSPEVYEDPASGEGADVREAFPDGSSGETAGGTAEGSRAGEKAPSGSRHETSESRGDSRARHRPRPASISYPALSSLPTADPEGPALETAGAAGEDEVGDGDDAGARLPYRVWLGAWEAVGTEPGRFFPLRLRIAEEGAGVDLLLEPLGPPVLQGEAGLSQKGPEPGNASYYYSMPRLAASGTVTSGDVEHAVTGTVWMDREWSTSALSPDEVGWDWFALHLDPAGETVPAPGWDLMLYRIRRADGTASPASAGSLAPPTPPGASPTVPVEPVRLGWDDVRLTVTRRWESPAGGRYPAGWRIEVPARGVDVTVEPLLPDQELTLTFRYWEGAVRVTGRHRGRAIEGVGYVELTGYSEEAEDSSGISSSARSTAR